MNPQTPASFEDLLAEVTDRWADWTDEEIATLAIDDMAADELEEIFS